MFRQAPLWLIATCALVVLARFGWESAHRYHGDDAQLYLGQKQLLATGSYYVGLDYSKVASPGEDYNPADVNLPNAYPPHAAVFYRPFYLMPWPASHNAWTIFNLICLLGVGLLLFDMFGRNLPGWSLPLWLAGLFLTGPPFLVAFLGQTVFPILLFMLLAWRFHRSGARGSEIASGICYSIALIKPTISLPFLLYDLLRRRSRRAALWGAALTAVLTLVVMARGNGPAAMVAEYRATLQAFARPGGLNDARPGSESQASVCNIDVVYYDLLRPMAGSRTNAGDRIEIVLLALFAVGSLALVVRRARPADKRDATGSDVGADDANTLAFLSVFTILVFYHRWYDLGLLYVPAIIALNRIVVADRAERARLTVFIANLALLLFVFVRAKVGETVAAATGWSPAIVAYPARVLLLALWAQTAWELGKHSAKNKPGSGEPASK